ncbi:MAG TPA: excinuclease ABC subunit UvrC [Nitrososphaeraceae archaeon]
MPRLTEKNDIFIKLREIPEDPGVYLMKDSAGKIIYIGKAKSLRRRVTSYFSKQDISTNKIDMRWKTARLVKKIANIEFIATDNEIEAFLLESNLIKRFRPLFNIELKDQQRYTYLKITDESFPRLLVARRNQNGEFSGPKGKIYGPFVRGSSKFLTVGLLRKLFKIRICNKLPKKPCLEYFIKNCDAPCINNVSRSQYMRNVLILQDILSGKSSIEKFVGEMEEEMKRAASIEHYEKAKEIRDTLHRLENLRIKQKMENVTSRNAEEEYIGILRNAEKGIAHIMTLRRKYGVITDRKKFEFELVGDNSLGTFLLQYYSSLPVIPRFVYVNEDPESKGILEASLEKLCEHKVNIINISNSLHITEKKQLMDLVIRNLALSSEYKHLSSAVELRKLLKLSRVPEIIDCFDVSNFGTTFAVGARTRFIGAKPCKAAYRRFKIRTISGQNDVAMIGEIVRRSYSSSSAGDKLPDLLVVDGGRGQLASAMSAINNLSLDIPCISLAKEREEVYTHPLNEPLVISRQSDALKLLQNIRDEAHRFSLAYNIRLRKFN